MKPLQLQGEDGRNGTCTRRTATFIGCTPHLPSPRIPNASIPLAAFHALIFRRRHIRGGTVVWPCWRRAPPSVGRCRWEGRGGWGGVEDERGVKWSITYYSVIWKWRWKASGSLAPNALPSPRPQGGIFCMLCSWIHYLVGIQKLLINGFDILKSLLEALMNS